MPSEPGFPLTMHHPGHAPAVLSTASVVGDWRKAKPERFPPVEVHSSAQEAQYRAQGYLRHGEHAEVSVSEYSRYPLMMRHPDRVDAVAESSEAHQVDGQVIISRRPGMPGKFPDVTVNDEDEEDAWRDKGYEVQGNPSEEAFEHTVRSHGEAGDEWPKWIDGELVQDPDAPADDSNYYPLWVHFDDGSDSVLVKDHAEHSRVLSAHGMPPVEDRGSSKNEPVKHKPYVEPTPTVDADELAAFRAWKAAQKEETFRPMAESLAALITDRDKLVADAEELGIRVDRRWGDERLRAEIEQALEGATAE